MSDQPKEIVVISGKGGTGKTTLTSAFARLASGNVSIADCDVDASDLHLVLEPTIISKSDFTGLDLPRIDPEICTRCGLCKSRCRFGAISDEIEIVRESCEGCGVCELVCPVNAITMEPRIDGEIYSSDTLFGPMAHARLRPGGEASGKLVSIVRAEARKMAVSKNLDLILSDGPPGIGCPVISSI